MPDKLDPRLNAYRPDLADIALKDRVKAKKFVQGKKMRISTPVANIYAKQGCEDSIISQLLMGDDVLLFDHKNDFSFIQSLKDRYVGYVETKNLNTEKEILTHYVSTRSTFLYPRADLKSVPLQALSLGTKITIVEFITSRDLCYGLTQKGHAIVARHISQLNQKPDDFVTIAEMLLHTPYLWGGTSSFGIDCSGLVQLSLAICGIQVLRDSDMQCETIGYILTKQETKNLQRGDLVFWPGHVAIMQNYEKTIHANGKTMDVASQYLSNIIENMGSPLCYRRFFK